MSSGSDSPVAPGSSSGDTPAPERCLRETEAGLSNAAFWKKRLARALLVGAFALFATQVLPELPTDQRVEVEAPHGYRLDRVSIVYFHPGEPEALSGTQLSFAPPAPRAFHQTRLKNGTYRIQVRAEVHSSRREAQVSDPEVVHVDQTLTLAGERVKIFLHR